MTPTQRAAVAQALECLESLQGGCTDSNDGTVEALTVWCPEAIDALRAALTEPPNYDDFDKLAAEVEADLTMRPHLEAGRKWAQELVQRQPLTHMQAVSLWGHRSDGPTNSEIVGYARAVERFHGIGDSNG